MTPSSLPPRPTVTAHEFLPCKEDKRPWILDDAANHDDELRLDEVGAWSTLLREHGPTDSGMENVR